ncbi:MAG: biopolymer transporter ExbD [Desulfovibrio sp.]|jgi:biopolymer transport protein ExbD|nr:biopolymer transporter ExbD [Desulfovibrio sp.]
MMRRRQRREAAELNLTPIIDMIFILLIFFMVTASFVRESGVDVERPVASTSETKNPSVIVSIDAGNLIWIDRQTIDVRSVRAWMAQFLSEAPEGGVIIAADTMARSGLLVQVLDACREAGVKNVSVATRSP